MAGFITLAIIVWFGLQFRPRGQAKWGRRWRAIEPLIVHFGRDAAATGSAVKAYVKAAWMGKSAAVEAQRVAAETDMDDELRKLFG